MTNSRTQGDYVLEATPDTIFTRVSAWLDDKEDDIIYSDLKAHLLSEFTQTPSARAQRLLSFPQQPLGDRTAAAVWTEMQSIACLPGIDSSTGKNKRVDIMRELWLQTLPSSVPFTLHDAHDLSMPELIQKADNLIIPYQAAQKPGAIAAVEDSDDATVNSMLKRDRGRRSGPRGYLLASGVCSYHKKFRDAAGNCLLGCTLTKNAQ